MPPKKGSGEPYQEPKKRPETIEDLGGVGPATAEKLRELGYHTIESLATATINELVPAGISEKQAAKIISQARESISIEFIHADELVKMRQNVARLTTGSKTIDDLLGGGLETQTITEFYGQYGVGKSILCHQLCVNVQLPVESGGLEGGALYIDTEQTFRPEWIVRISKHLGLDPDKVAQNIIYSEAYNSDHQILLLDKADQIIKENNIRLIIVDSLTAHFRSEYLGREMLAERQQKLNKHMHRLTRLARVFNTVAVVTNQVMARPDAFFTIAVEAAGGHIVAHTCLHPDTLVQLADGSIEKISRVHNPSKLMSVDLKKTLQTERGRCDGVWETELPEILRINAGFEVRASPNHRFFKLHDIDVIEVHAKDLKVGDYVACIRKMEIEGTPQRILKHEQNTCIPTELSPDLSQILGYILGCGNIIGGDIVLFDKNLSVIEFYRRKVSETFNLNCRISRRRRGKYWLRIESGEATDLLKKLSCEWNKIIPKSPRECVASFIKGFADARGYVSNSLRLIHREKNILEILQLLMLRFTVKSTIHRIKDAWSLHISEAVSLINFIENIGLTDKDKIRRLVLKTKNIRIKSDVIPVSAEILRGLARYFGVTPCELPKPIGNRFMGRLQLAEYVRTIKSSPNWDRAPREVVDKVMKLERLVESPLGWEKVKSIVREPSDSPVYDISVSPHANFIANGLLVHNSHTRVFLRRTANSPIRIARLVSSPYLPEGERLFKITENGIEDVDEKEYSGRR
ncbi:MAG: DNA repair and recombination protein RadA [Candidatus Bathyarchaeia archaeon]